MNTPLYLALGVALLLLAAVLDSKRCGSGKVASLWKWTSIVCVVALLIGPVIAALKCLGGWLGV